MWLVTVLVAHAHVPRSDVISLVDQRTLPTRARTPWALEPIDEDGIVAYTEDRGAMVVRRYDVDLSLQWSMPLPEIVQDAPVLTLHRDNAAWAVFQGRSLAVVTRHAIDDGAMKTWVVPLAHRARRVVDFETVGDDAWLVMVDGRTAGGGGLRHLDLVSGTSRTVKLPPAGDTIELQRLSADPLRNVVDVSYRTELDGRFTQHVAVGHRGRLVNDVVLQVPDLNLLDIQRRTLPDGGRLAVGSYADETMGTRAQGLYAARYDSNGRLIYVATHSFTHLSHFFDDLSGERRRARQAQAAERHLEGEDIDIDVRFAMHDVQWVDGQVVLSGEIFAPRLGTMQRVAVLDIDGGIRAESLDVGDGYWFTHAVVAAFDPDGSVAWDASLPLRNVGGSRIVPHVKVGVDGEVATLAYVSGDTLITRVFEQGRLVEDPARTSLIPPDRAAVQGGGPVVEPWFDDQWVSYGVQRVRGAGGRQLVIQRLASAPAQPAQPPQATIKPVPVN